jgi:predicted Zn-dependent protease
MIRVVILLLLVMLSGVTFSAEIFKENPDSIDVYIVPMDDFPEEIAGSISKFMSEEMHVWAKSSLKLGALDVNRMPGTNQLIAEEIIEKSQVILRRLPNATTDTYFVLLTTRDINSRGANLRFVLSSHNKKYNTSVVSLQRLINFSNGKPVFDEVSQLRLYKMMKRAIGEMHYGWKRSTDINDIMYSPIMGIPDLDRIGLSHSEERKRNH